MFAHLGMPSQALQIGKLSAHLQAVQVAPILLRLRGGLVAHRRAPAAAARGWLRRCRPLAGPRRVAFRVTGRVQAAAQGICRVWQRHQGLSPAREQAAEPRLDLRDALLVVGRRCGVRV